MSDDYDYVYEVWTDLVVDACRADDPRHRVLSLLLEFESGVYNRALNDVLLNFEKDKERHADAALIRKMLLSSCVCSDDPRVEKADVIPFPVT